MTEFLRLYIQLSKKKESVLSSHCGKFLRISEHLEWRLTAGFHFPELFEIRIVHIFCFAFRGGEPQDDPVIIGSDTLRAPFLKIVEGVGKSGSVFKGERISVIKFSEINVCAFGCFIQDFLAEIPVRIAEAFE